MHRLPMLGVASLLLIGLSVAPVSAGSGLPFMAKADVVSVSDPMPIPQVCGDPVEGFLGQEVVWVGTGTHLGRFDEFETVCLDMGAPPLVPFVVYGKFVAANGDELAYYIEGLFNLATQEGTDGGLNFTGGTGRFTNASGWAEAQLIRDAQGNTIASRLPGWISYEASDRSMP
jgi:hypothetical protein